MDDGIFHLIALFCTKTGFDDKHPHAVILDDGLTFKSPKDKYGTIFFGDFCNVKDKYNRKLSVTFHLLDVTYNHIGFGFATPEFTDFELTDFNSGKNHSKNIKKMEYYNQHLIIKNIFELPLI